MSIHGASTLDLSQSQRKTTGDVPPASVGATVTVVGKKVYVIAGRLVEARKMTADIYMLDLESFVWTKVELADALHPTPRYFHTANAHGTSIVIFGGMSAATSSDALCVLNDVALFDTISRKWKVCASASDEKSVFQARYAHLSSVSAGKLVVIGGQDRTNAYLEDAGIFDLTTCQWQGIYPIVGQSGAYRSLTVTASRPMMPGYAADVSAELHLADEMDPVTSVSPISSRGSWVESTKASIAPSGDSLNSARRPSTVSQKSATTPSTPRRPNLRKKSEHDAPESREQQPAYDWPANAIYLYSNFNFVDVERHLQLIDPPKNGFVMHDISDTIKGADLPPGLRFPSGSIVGNFLIVSGTYLSNTSQIFAIWSLNLQTSSWSRIEIAPRLSAGSWNKGMYCDALDKFIIMGHRERSLVEDYNYRQVNFNHLVMLDLEAFGVIEPVTPSLSPLACHLGARTLSDSTFCDMELITRDQTSIPVSSEMLRMRWPEYFTFLSMPVDSSHGPRPDSMVLGHAEERLRRLYMPHPHAFVYTFVLFLYTDNLPDGVKLDISLLCSLMLFVAKLDAPIHSPLERLLKLCRGQLHARLSRENAARIAQVSLLASQYGLEARARRMAATAENLPVPPSLDAMQESHFFEPQQSSL